MATTRSPLVAVGERHDPRESFAPIFGVWGKKGTTHSCTKKFSEGFVLGVPGPAAIKKNLPGRVWSGATIMKWRGGVKRAAGMGATPCIGKCMEMTPKSVWTQSSSGLSRHGRRPIQSPAGGYAQGMRGDEAPAPPSNLAESPGPVSRGGPPRPPNPRHPKEEATNRRARGPATGNAGRVQSGHQGRGPAGGTGHSGDHGGGGKGGGGGGGGKKKKKKKKKKPRPEYICRQQRLHPDPLHHRPGAARAPVQGVDSPGGRHRVDLEAGQTKMSLTVREPAQVPRAFQQAFHPDALRPPWPGADRPAVRRADG